MGQERIGLKWFSSSVLAASRDNLGAGGGQLHQEVVKESDFEVVPELPSPRLSFGRLCSLPVESRNMK